MVGESEMLVEDKTKKEMKLSVKLSASEVDEVDRGKERIKMMHNCD